MASNKKGRMSVMVYAWMFVLSIIALFSAQQVGINAQFTFGLSAIAFMLVIRTLKLKGIWQHVFMVLGATIVFRYMYWRMTSTLPSIDDPVNFFFGGLLFFAEFYSVSMLFVSFFLISDPIERKDAPILGEMKDYPTVDIYVPSYNEDLDLVGTTLAAAKNLDYPADRFNVYLLDDGGTDQKCFDSDPKKAQAARERRAEMSAFCKDLGVTYLTRARNEHAKAGNMNSAMAQTNGDLIVIFDADHAPTRDFLQNTVGYFQRDPKLFLVQTPHFFLNPDPVEKNLDTFQRMPSENEMFYSIIQKGLDKWNGTFFCGSAAMISRAALRVTGGFSGESITEDCETALELHSKGWNSIYVDKPMIAGLQPETFVSFIGQRARWCQGMLQILILKRPMFRKGLTMPQRVCYTSSPLFWLFPLSRLTFVAAPALYIFFDLQIYNASFQEFVAYTTFFLISNILMQNRIYGRVRWPWVSELYEYVQSIHLAKSIFLVVKNPRAPSFQVTDKGQTLDESHLSPIAMPFFVAFTLLTATTGYASFRIASEGLANELLVIVTAWSVFNLIIAAVALGAVCELRERRRHYRIPISRKGMLKTPEGNYPVTISDVSLDGMMIRPTSGSPVPYDGMKAKEASVVVETGGAHGYPFKVTLRHTTQDDQGPGIGAQLRDKSANDFRAIAALLYTNTSRFDEIRKRRHTGRAVSGGTFEFIYWAVYHTVRSTSYLMAAVTSRKPKDVKPEAQPAPLVVETAVPATQVVNAPPLVPEVPAADAPMIEARTWAEEQKAAQMQQEKQALAS